MSSELEPCPFCGGEAELQTVEDYTFWLFYVRCNNFSCLAETRRFKDRKKAVEAWNKRAERTCENRATRKDGFWCSECNCAIVGCMMDDFGSFENPLRFSYCPNCRARVVGD